WTWTAGMRWRRAQWRTIGIGSAERSMTFDPEEIRPEARARWIIRADRVESREMATVAPFAKRAPTEAPSRAANSGVNSTLARPVMPYAVNRPRFQEPAQMSDSRATE